MRPRRKPETQSQTILVKDARAQLAMLLASARSIESFTAADLARRYRVPANEVAERLDHERARRARLL